MDPSDGSPYDPAIIALPRRPTPRLFRERALSAAAAVGLAAGVVFAVVTVGCGGAPPPPPPDPIESALAGPPTSPVAPSAPEEPPVAEDSAYLDILSGSPTEVRLDGQSIGRTPIEGYKVSPGTHEVTFVFSPDNTPTVQVTVEAFKGAVVKLDPPPALREAKSDDEKSGKDSGKK